MSLLNKLREIKENRKEKKEEEIQKHNARIDNAYFLFSPFVEESKREEFKALIKKAMDGDLKAYTEFAETMKVALKKFNELKIDGWSAFNSVYTVGTAIDEDLYCDQSTETCILTLFNQYFPSKEEDFEEVRAKVKSAIYRDSFENIAKEIDFAAKMYVDIIQEISVFGGSNASKVESLAKDISDFKTNIKSDPMTFLLMNPRYVYVLNEFLKNELDIAKEKVKDNWQKGRYNFLLSDMYADFFDESGAALVCPPATLAMLLLIGILGIIDAGFELVVGTPRAILSKLKSKNIQANQDLIKALNEMYNAKVRSTENVSYASEVAKEKLNSYLETDDEDDAEYLLLKAQSRLEELTEQYEEWKKIRQRIYETVETRFDKYLSVLIEENSQNSPRLSSLIKNFVNFLLNEGKYFSDEFTEKLENILYNNSNNINIAN